ncbi:MAG TPA: beta-galactosidase GalA, partial [Asticcacaulis sp.]|nr:beta-galactosidase GalA [Asticcacaulis sp.]
HLHFDDSDRGKHIEIQLDGIATHATVWFNGTEVRHSFSGYTSSYIDVTPLVNYGDKPNVLAVRCDAQAIEGWWYEGAGMYRDAWLVVRDPVHLITDGIYAFPVKKDGKWTIPVEATLFSNAAEDAADVEVVAELWADYDGQVLRSASTKVAVAALERGVANLTLEYDSPKLWSVDDPNLYWINVKLLRGGVVIDADHVQTGFRTARFDADKGFFLNDQPLKIQGVCLHQDHAGVGTAIPDSIWAFRLRRLKSLGCNAIRCSHNAPTKALLTLADRMGFLIMDENRLFNPSPDYMAQLLWMVRRDRNHPSVYLWSVFNEEPFQGTEQGYEIVRRMRQYVRDLDTNRPVTAAISNGMFNPANVTQAVDVVGFNYQQDKYDEFHAKHPGVPLMSSEDTSAFMTRGEYLTDKTKHISASYDDDAAPWGETQRAAWKAIAERDFIAGGFVWTGFDYHGEPTPYKYPSNSSVFGILDLCGFDKAAAHIHRAQWIKDKPVLGLVPHWNWAGQEGRPVRVMACTNADEVELFLNGKSQGRQKADKYQMNVWKVPYAPGRIEARAYKAGKLVLKTANATTGDAVALRLSGDVASLLPDGRDAAAITVEAVDAKGRTVPLAANMINYEITGGAIIGLGNGDSNSLEPEKGNKRSLFNGLGQVIVQSLDGQKGTLQLRATSPGLKAAVLSLTIG